MSQFGHLVVYVTSHGFGHLNRAVSVLNRLPAELRLTIRCSSSLFDHWGERLRRPADLQAFVCDSGAVNPSGDSSATDGEATVIRAAEVHARAMAGLDEEVDRLRRLGATAVLCDVPAPPLVAAARAGIPGLALANFTWAEIYHEHAEKLGPEAMDFVEELRNDFSQATLLFQAQPCLPMPEFQRRIDVGMVVTPGRNRREELCDLLKLRPSSRLVYFYIGRYGQENLDWARFATLRDFHFIGFHPAPIGPIPNLHLVPPDKWTGTDLAVSTDVTVAKAGYGTVCEVIAAGRPFLYPPREGFAEHAALEEALAEWGGGVRIPPERFASLDLEEPLKRAFRLRPGSPPFPTDGAETTACYLRAICRVKGQGHATAAGITVERAIEPSAARH